MNKTILSRKKRCYESKYLTKGLFASYLFVLIILQAELIFGGADCTIFGLDDCGAGLDCIDPACSGGGICAAPAAGYSGDCCSDDSSNPLTADGTIASTELGSWYCDETEIAYWSPSVYGDCDYVSGDSYANPAWCEATGAGGWSHPGRGLCVYTGSAQNCDEGDVCWDGTYYRASCTICGATSERMCDYDVYNNGFEADGVCALGAVAGSEVCDTGQVCYDGSSYRTGCSLCYTSGLTDRPCDSNVDLGNYISEGICLGDGTCDTTDMACYQDSDSKFKDDCSECDTTYSVDPTGDQCDTSIVLGSYTANGMCTYPNTCTPVGSEIVAEADRFWVDCVNDNGDLCDSSSSYSFAPDGVCVAENNAAVYSCDIDEVCEDAVATYDNDCRYCTLGDVCDSNVISSGFQADGVCTWDEGGTTSDTYYDCATGTVCDDTGGGAYRPLCSLCDAGDGCMLNVGTLGYTRDGKCAGSSCCTTEYLVGGTCGCASGGEGCDGTPEEGLPGELEGVCADNICDGDDVAQTGATYHSCDGYGGIRCDSDTSSGTWFQTGMCWDNAATYGCDASGFVFYDGTYYDHSTYVSSTDYNTISNPDGVSCDRTISGVVGDYSPDGMIINGGICQSVGVSVYKSTSNNYEVNCLYGGEPCDSVTSASLLSPWGVDGICAGAACRDYDVVNFGGINPYRHTCNGYGGKECDTDTSNGVYNQDGMCFFNPSGSGFDCMTTGYIFYDGTYYDQSADVTTFDYDRDNDGNGRSCDSTITSGGDYSQTGMVTTSGCTPVGSIVRAASTTNYFTPGCDFSGVQCDSSIASSLTAPWAEDGLCASSACTTNGNLVTRNGGTYYNNCVIDNNECDSSLASATFSADGLCCAAAGGCTLTGSLDAGDACCDDSNCASGDCGPLGVCLGITNVDSCDQGTDCISNNCIDNGGGCGGGATCRVAGSGYDGLCCSKDSDIYTSTGGGTISRTFGGSWDCYEAEVASYSSDFWQDCVAPFNGAPTSAFECDIDVQPDYVMTGICTYQSGAATSLTVDCDSNGACFDDTYYRESCSQCSYTTADTDSCDPTTNDGAYSSLGKCVADTTTCDTGETCINGFDSGTLYSDCSNGNCLNGYGCDNTGNSVFLKDGRCGGNDCCTSLYVNDGTCTCGAGDADYCDTDPGDAGSGFDGVCTAGPLTCDINDVCLNGGTYYGAMGSCVNNDACDTAVHVGGAGYSRDGYVCGGTCVEDYSLGTGATCCINANCASNDCTSFVCQQPTYPDGTDCTYGDMCDSGYCVDQDSNCFGGLGAKCRTPGSTYDGLCCSDNGLLFNHVNSGTIGRTNLASSWDCDHDEMVLYSADYYQDCYYPWLSTPSSETTCDIDVAPNYVASGICSYSTGGQSIATVDCDNDEMCHDDTGYRSDCDYCSVSSADIDACDSDVSIGTNYIAEGYCTSGGTCSIGTVHQVGATLFDGCSDGVGYASCDSDATGSENGLFSTYSDGMCVNGSICDSDDVYYDDELDTYYGLPNTSMMDHDTDASGDSCDTDVSSGAYTRNGMVVFSGGVPNANCLIFNANTVVRVDSSSGNKYVAGCGAADDGDACDSAIVNSYDPYLRDGYCCDTSCDLDNSLNLGDPCCNDASCNGALVCSGGVCDAPCVDSDLDGFYSTTSGAGCAYPRDCDDNDANILPPYDGLTPTADTILCNGTYYINDSGLNGVITFGANDISITCNNTQIIGNTTGYGFNITNVQRVNLSGCNASNYSYSMRVLNSPDATLYNLSSTYSAGTNYDVDLSPRINMTELYAYNATTGQGFSVDDSPNSTFINLTAISHDEAGFDIDNCSNSTAIDITSRYNGAGGIAFGYSGDSYVCGLDSRGDGGFGIVFQFVFDYEICDLYAFKPIASGATTGMLFFSSTTSNITGGLFSNSTYGVYSWNSNQLLFDNVESLNTTAGLYFSGSNQNTLFDIYSHDNDYGIILNQSDNNILNLSNFAYNNYGIYFAGASNNNITNTTIDTSPYNVYLNDTSTNNLFYYNSFLSSGTDHAYAESAGNFFNKTVWNGTHNIGHGNYWDDILSLDIYDSDADGFGDAGTALPYSLATGGDVSANVEDYGPITTKGPPAPPAEANMVIFGPNGTEFTNTRNVHINISFGISVACRWANDAEVNLATQPWENCTTVKPWILSEGEGNKTVYMEVRNSVGATSVTNDSIMYRFIQDYTPPTAPMVYDGISGFDIDWQNSNTTASAYWWNATDDISTLYYRYRLLNNSQCYIAGCPWTDAGTDDDAELTGLSLLEGWNVSFQVMTYVESGWNSSISTSNGSIIDLTKPNAPIINSTTNPSQLISYDSSTVKFNFTAIDPISNSVASGIDGYSYTFDKHPGTAPDNNLEARFWEPLHKARNDGTAQLLRQNSSGTDTYAVYSQIKENVTVGDDIKVRVSLAEINSDYDDDMGVKVFLISAPDGAVVGDFAFDMESDTITTIANVSQDIRYSENLAQATIYEFDLQVTSTTTDDTDDIFVVVTGIESDDDNRNNLSIAASSNDIDNATTTFVCDETDVCTEQTYLLDFGIRVTREDKGDVWDTQYKDVRDGTYYFHVKAKDRAGNWGDTSHYQVIVDTAGVAVDITSPFTGQVFSNASIEVVTEVNEHANVSVIVLYEDGTDDTTPWYNFTDTFTFNVTIHNGTNEIYAIANNTANGVVTYSQSVYVRFGTDLPDSDKTLRVVYGVGDDMPESHIVGTSQGLYFIGIATENDAAIFGGNDILADTRSQTIKIFATTDQILSSKVEADLRDDDFLDRVNPMFGYEKGVPYYVIRTETRPISAYIDGDRRLSAGKYTFVFKNVGVTPDGKTNISVRIV